MPVKTQKIQLKVSDGTEMQAYVSKPAELQPIVGIIVFQEAFGVNAHIRAVTDRLAEHGYVCVAPELFHRSAPPGFEGAYDNFPAIAPHFKALSDAGTEADAKAAFEWLQSQGVTHIGCVGFCMGGRVSYLTNSTLPYKAAVSYYGGGIGMPDYLAKAKDQKGPLLLHWGGADQHIPPDQIRAAEDALRSAKKNFINVVYSQADHGFNCDARPSYNAEAAEQAWVLTHAFFKLHLSKV
ncbi:MAG TPA: dienelactone hydrolase family protein [bacterium]|nr:dienelactone hydrolase family protein [bacterium]